MKKKVLIGISLVLLVVVAIVGVTKYRGNMNSNKEIESIVKSDEVKETIENTLRAIDDKALTPEGKIKSYKIEYDESQRNPMGGIGVYLIINDDPEMKLNTTLQKGTQGKKYETGALGRSPKLRNLTQEKRGAITISDKENIYLTNQAYVKDPYLGMSLETSDKKYVATLSDINDNRTNNGERIFLYTKTIDGEDVVKPDAQTRDRIKVKEVTILFQGLPSDAKEGDSSRVLVEKALKTTKSILSNDKAAVERLNASSEYLKDIMEKYPFAKINIYGHLLGGADAQYALANVTDYDRIKSVYLYNSPNVFPILSYEQRLNASALYDNINNFIDSKDIAGFGYEKDKGTVGKIYEVSGLESD